MITKKFIEMVQSKEFKGFNVLSVNICEYEETGKALIERPEGTPTSIEWSKEREDWI